MRHKWWGTLNRGTLLCPVTVISYTFLSICSLHPPPFQLYLHIFLSSQFSIWWSSCDLIPTKPTPAAQAVQDLSSPGPWGHLGQYASLALTMITSSSFVQRKSETKPKICLYCQTSMQDLDLAKCKMASLKWAENQGLVVYSHQCSKPILWGLPKTTLIDSNAMERN